MKNYEAIKKMSIEEMAAIFYIFSKPMLEAIDASEEQKKTVREDIRKFLNAEVKK